MMDVGQTLGFVERHGYALLFLWVLAEQSAIPVPSGPLMLATGALIRTGRLHIALAILCCVTAALIADTIWYELGRHRGRKILRLVCRVSLEPDTCVRQTENAFLKYGMRSLLISKFVPGLNAVAAPLAGQSKRPYVQFVLYDGVGATIWCGAYFLLGYVFSDQLETVVAYGSRMGSNLFLLVVGLFAIWIGWKYIQRRRFLSQLNAARITPSELYERLGSGEELFIIDLRGGVAEEPPLIPGAVRISPEQLKAQGKVLPRDRDIILFCS
jgi:membrane protein DedA with SNARE-associated domain